MMIAAWDSRLRGELRFNESMARHSSWRAGGVAARFYQPADLHDLGRFLHQLDEAEPVVWVGLGSNLLVRDGGIPATVIATAGRLNRLSRLDEDRVRAEAGVTCAKVARFCAAASLEGVEFLAGIPGTLGGALAMNAGAFGGETWDRVASVETLDRSGIHRVRTPDDFRISYRRVVGPSDEWFVAATLRLQRGDREAGQARIRALLRRRAETQPTQQPSCGSVFRNPPGDPAARLIESAGLKGACIGGVCVSSRHANFIVNTGAASAEDIEALIDHVCATVARVHGVDLVREVQIIGERRFTEVRQSAER